MTRNFCQTQKRTCIEPLLVYTVHNITEQSEMEMPPLKSEIMVYKRQVQIRSKTVVDNTPMRVVRGD